ncbi:MAG TPA: MarP family serine protease [Candidatus Binatia bacterium]|nr:MarP family serine protease [Candidatus Binatia bacterium]
MNLADWVAIAIVLAAAVGGMRRGLVLSAFSLVGLAAGAYVGSRIAPHVLHGGSSSTWTPVAGLVGAVLGAVLLQFAALLAGSFIRGGLRLAPLRLIDTAGGLLLGGAIGVGIVWVGASVALLSPGETRLRQEVERSAIVKQLDAALPPRTLLNLLARIDPFPSIVGPKAPSLPPSKGVLRDQSIRDAATRVVKVLGTACGVGIEGSGWFAATDLIVTAAHVVAGEADTIVRIPGQPFPAPADVVLLDVHNDIAILRVSGIDVKPLPLADPQPSAEVAILGYPLDAAELQATPGRIGLTATVLTQDALGHGPVARTITAVAGRVEHGDSGGPAVDADGKVESTIFAAHLGTASGYGVPPSIVRDDLANAGTKPVSTGSCAP